MRGPAPKDPALRQRRNKVTTKATLEDDSAQRKRAPLLPKRSEGRDWQALTCAWWRDVWRSPMAGEYLQADIHSLYRLAVLIDQFWADPDKELAAEITREQQAFGLTPIDRRRLQWEVERTEAALRKKRPASPTSAAGASDDPRRRLSVVS